MVYNMCGMIFKKYTQVVYFSLCDDYDLEIITLIYSIQNNTDCFIKIIPMVGIKELDCFAVGHIVSHCTGKATSCSICAVQHKQMLRDTHPVQHTCSVLSSNTFRSVVVAASHRHTGEREGFVHGNMFDVDSTYPNNSSRYAHRHFVTR